MKAMGYKVLSTVIGTCTHPFRAKSARQKPPTSSYSLLSTSPTSRTFGDSSDASTDDFFAFIIRMPLMHRLACFRDDVVFLILLYQVCPSLSLPSPFPPPSHVFQSLIRFWCVLVQMWIYRVDPNRENEYGTSSLRSFLPFLLPPFLPR